MNPFTLVNGEPYPLDMWGELDDTAAFKNFRKWGSIEFPLPFGRVMSPSESAIHGMDEKKKHALPDQLLEVIKYIHHLQNTLIELEKKKYELSLSVTVETFSNASGVYKDLQVSEARPFNVTETFPIVRVSNFGPGIQVTANAFKNQIELSLIMVLEEAGVEVLSEFAHFDSAVLHERIGQLIKGILPSNSEMK